MRKSKYYKGMILKHNKYNFKIQLTEKQRFNKWMFEVIEGDIPHNLRPDLLYDNALNFYEIYSTSTFNSSFTPIGNSALGRILYGD